MKPGHTIFWKRRDGEFVEGVVGLAVGIHPDRKTEAVEMTHLMERNMDGQIDVFDLKNGKLATKHEMNYMKSNSKMYERS